MANTAARLASGHTPRRTRRSPRAVAPDRGPAAHCRREPIDALASQSTHTAVTTHRASADPARPTESRPRRPLPAGIGAEATCWRPSRRRLASGTRPPRHPGDLPHPQGAQDGLHRPTTRIFCGRPDRRTPIPLEVDDLGEAINSDDPARAALAALLVFHALRPRQLRSLHLTDLRDGRLHLDSTSPHSARGPRKDGRLPRLPSPTLAEHRQPARIHQRQNGQPRTSRPTSGSTRSLACAPRPSVRTGFATKSKLLRATSGASATCSV